MNRLTDMACLVAFYMLRRSPAKPNLKISFWNLIIQTAEI